jgi:GntR family transcriptional repressor for pyruvate dehydrogenase complex
MIARVRSLAMADPRAPGRAPKSGALVASSIRQMIVRGEVTEGEVLPPENVLTERFEVSRPTLREAFRILESEGLISVRRGSRGGARVHPPNEAVAAKYTAAVLQARGETVAGYYQARAVVEAPAAAMVARRRDRKSAAKQLQALLDRADPADPHFFPTFHRRVVELAGNNTLMLLTVMLEHISEIVSEQFMPAMPEPARPGPRRALRSYQKLVDLIREGNAEEAQAFWRTHLTEQADFMAEHLGRDERLNII